MTKPNSTILGRLGHMDGYQAGLYVLDFYVSTILTCRYGIPKGFIHVDLQSKLEGVLEAAVGHVVLQHPLMQVGLANLDSAKPAWVQLNQVNLKRHIEWKLVGDSEDYVGIRTQVVKEQLDTKYEAIETQPGWRMTVLRKVGGDVLEIIFAWNHPHFDGTSAKIFHEHLLLRLNTSVNEGEPSQVQNHILKTNATSQNLPPPQENLVEFKSGLRFAASILWKEIKPPILSKSSSLMASWPDIRLPPPYETRFRTLTIDQRTLKGLLMACRAHDTTITGLLHAVTLVSLAQKLSKDIVSAFSSITALSMRRYIPSNPPSYPGLNPNQTMANYVTKMDHKFDESILSQIRGLAKTTSSDTVLAPLEAVMWSVAKSVREEIRNRLDLGLRNQAAEFMGLVRDWRAYMKGLASKPRECSWLVTNIGVLDSGTLTAQRETAREWSIQRAFFTLSADVVSSAISLSCVTVKDGNICVDISWQFGVVDDAIGDKLADDVANWLVYVGSKPKVP